MPILSICRILTINMLGMLAGTVKCNFARNLRIVKFKAMNFCLQKTLGITFSVCVLLLFLGCCWVTVWGFFRFFYYYFNFYVFVEKPQIKWEPGDISHPVPQSFHFTLYILYLYCSIGSFFFGRKKKPKWLLVCEFLF